MKRSFHIILVVLFAIFAFSSFAAESVTAKGQGPFAEFRLNASDPSAEAEFGRSVAIDGNLVAVGASGDGSIGEVYLYRRQGMVYVPEAKLDFPENIPENCISGVSETCPEFGRSVVIHGNTVLVGARFASFGEMEGVGAVYVFQKQKDSWEWEDKIVSPDPEEGDNFGRALAIQGNQLMVTARKSA